MPEPTHAQRTGEPFSRLEVFSLLALVAAFFLINLFTADKTPAVWCDEVMYQDPAVNLYQHHGFTSGAWYAQSLDKFWAGNVPLYQFVLYGWLKLFGFGLVAVRSFHYAMFGLAVIIAWLAARRLGLISAPTHRLVFCVVFLLSSADTFVYRSARPESLSLVLVALALFAFSVEPRGWRLFLLAMSGGLLIWSGLQMGPYLFLLCGLAWLTGPRRFRLENIVACAGCVAGMGCLYLFYKEHGVWNDFVASIRRHTIANEGVHYDVIPGYGVGLKNKLARLPSVYLDYSFMPLALTAAWMGWRLWRARVLSWSSPFWFCALAALLVPVTLHIIGVFPLYYFWMAFLPLALGVSAELGNFRALPTGRLQRCLLVFLVTAVCLLGLPRRLAVAAFEWRARSYEPVMKLAAPYVPANATVFSEYAAYYAAKQNGASVILPAYFPMLRAEDKARLSVAILHNPDAAALARDFGGQWHEAAVLTPPSARMALGLHEQLGSQQYNLHVLVREGGASTHF